MPDPIVQELSTGVVVDQQPYIHHLTRTAELATQAGKCMEFLNHVVRMLWDGSTDNWNEGDHLSRSDQTSDLEIKRERIKSKEFFLIMTQDLFFLNQEWVGFWILKAIREFKLQKKEQE